MKLKATLNKPCKIDERIDFIEENFYNKKYVIKETDEFIQAWENTSNEKLELAKKKKYDEANIKAHEYIESGEALYEFEEGKHVEATDGNIGKFTGYALGFVTGRYQPTDTVPWSTKEDENVNLTATQVDDILNGMGAVQAEVWTVKFPAYLQMIQEAETVEEVENIVIDYEAVSEEESEE